MCELLPDASHKPAGLAWIQVYLWVPTLDYVMVQGHFSNGLFGSETKVIHLSVRAQSWALSPRICIPEPWDNVVCWPRDPPSLDALPWPSLTWSAWVYAHDQNPNVSNYLLNKMWVCLLLVIIKVIMQHGNLEQMNCICAAGLCRSSSTQTFSPWEGLWDSFRKAFQGEQLKTHIDLDLLLQLPQSIFLKYMFLSDSVELYKYHKKGERKKQDRKGRKECERMKQ